VLSERNKTQKATLRFYSHDILEKAKLSGIKENPGQWLPGDRKGKADYKDAQRNFGGHGEEL
jgi:hypothetical protein